MTASLRWARWAILLGAIALAAVLAGTGWANHASLRASARELVEGEGLVLAQSLHSSMRSLGRPATADDLQGWLDDNADRGVRYAAFGGGRHRLEAGTPTILDALPPRPSAPVDLRRVGDRVRVVMAPPHPPRRRGRPNRFPAPRPPPEASPGAVVEFVPVGVNQLLARTQRDLFINLGVGAALLAMGLLAFRWLRRREALELVRARESHLARLGAMSAVLAHEIRNPLASLKGHAQLLSESTENDKQRAKVDRIVGEAVRLETLTGQLLAFAKTGAVERRACDPAALVREAADEVAADRIDVIADAAPDSWSLDPDRLRHALTNVMRNAVEASPEGERVEAEVAVAGDALAIRVRDRGPGLAAGDEDKIFEAFHTTRTRGTGLGLAVARRVVELHGGTIGAVGRDGGGAEFTMTIPRGNR